MKMPFMNRILFALAWFSAGLILGAVLFFDPSATLYVRNNTELLFVPREALGKDIKLIVRDMGDWLQCEAYTTKGQVKHRINVYDLGELPGAKPWPIEDR